MRLDPKKNYGFSIKTNSTDRLPRWDRFYFEKMKYMAENCECVLDFGGSVRSIKEIVHFKKILTVDIMPEINIGNPVLDIKPDIVADICNLHMFKDNSVEGVICDSILPYVYDPFTAVEELHRILKKDGKLFVKVHFLFGYGPCPGVYKDYWRFTKDGIKYLFLERTKFSKMEYEPVRYSVETILNLNRHFGKYSLFHELFGKNLFKMAKYNDRNTSGFNIFLIK